MSCGWPWRCGCCCRWTGPCRSPPSPSRCRRCPRCGRRRWSRWFSRRRRVRRRPRRRRPVRLCPPWARSWPGSGWRGRWVCCCGTAPDTSWSGGGCAPGAGRSQGTRSCWPPSGRESTASRRCCGRRTAWLPCPWGSSAPWCSCPPGWGRRRPPWSSTMSSPTSAAGTSGISSCSSWSTPSTGSTPWCGGCAARRGGIWSTAATTRWWPAGTPPFGTTTARSSCGTPPTEPASPCTPPG